MLSVLPGRVSTGSATPFALSVDLFMMRGIQQQVGESVTFPGGVSGM
jgi:hypothetical protein